MRGNVTFETRRQPRHPARIYESARSIQAFHAARTHAPPFCFFKAWAGRGRDDHDELGGFRGLLCPAGKREQKHCILLWLAARPIIRTCDQTAQRLRRSVRSIPTKIRVYFCELMPRCRAWPTSCHHSIDENQGERAFPRHRLLNRGAEPTQPFVRQRLIGARATTRPLDNPIPNFILDPCPEETNSNNSKREIGRAGCAQYTRPRQGEFNSDVSPSGHDDQDQNQVGWRSCRKVENEQAPRLLPKRGVRPGQGPQVAPIVRHGPPSGETGALRPGV